MNFQQKKHLKRLEKLQKIRKEKIKQKKDEEVLTNDEDTIENNDIEDSEPIVDQPEDQGLFFQSCFVGVEYL